jgi:hypothetical protein
MWIARSFLLATFCAAFAGTPALAAPIVLDVRDASTLPEPAARKGTRNYRPDGSEPAATDAAGTQASTASKSEKLDQCMDTWDEGTHITKSKWREICIRQLDARD